jgi:hypothetical protein
LSPHPLPAGLPTHPAFQAALPPSSRRKTQDLNAVRVPLQSPRKINPGESQPGTLGYEVRNNNPVYTAASPIVMGGIDETIEASTQPINPHNDNLTPPPPPPPPAPPILKELQHLAMPPPPPPAPLAPLYRPTNTNTHSMISGVSQTSGVIEIVMDEEVNNTSAPTTAVDVTAPLQLPVRSSSISHTRGRSENDNSLSGRFSRAAERLRSASRGRNTSPLVERGKTTSPLETSPYESVPTPWSPTRSANTTPQMSSSTNMPTIERHPREVKAAMKDADGGMI